MNFQAAMAVLNDGIKDCPAKITCAEWTNSKGESLGVYYDAKSAVICVDLEYPKPITIGDYEQFKSLPFDFYIKTGEPELKNSWARSILGGNQPVERAQAKDNTSKWNIFGPKNNPIRQ